ncbi:MAG: glycoside hydrolase family 3 C-terminal domain-containing protein [Clostridia bacterium]|nr:glycoside hydrolase family 3 C-terminal domain-containing protein [Clostridia bacterium]
MMDHKTALARAHELVKEMTLEEKAGQLRFDAPAIERLGIPEYNWWSEALHGVARAGTATVFPQAIALAAMFDEKAIQDTADIISTEGRAKYNAASSFGDRDIYKGLTFWSPNINIFRDPRWGRGQETFGEDPYLTARTGCAFVRGLQGSGKYLKLAACAKHFAVHSGPEAKRHEFNAVADEKDLRETYLYAFEKLVRDADVESVMGAYNRTNGEPCCGSKRLLKDVLRDEWGFEGHVVSDCWAIKDFHENHHVTANFFESAALAIRNGCDINCGCTYRFLLEAVKQGLISEEEITRACEHAMATRIRLGMMDGDCEYDRISPLENDTDAHAAKALQNAEKAMVLLKNNGVLPLGDGIRTVAVIGPNADSIPALEGNYCGTSSRYVTFLAGIRAECEKRGIRVLYAKGCNLVKDRESGLARADDRLAEAKQAAALADAVILCVGLDPAIEGEQGDAGNEFWSGDKKDLYLPESQRKLLDAVLPLCKKAITVIAAGSALSVPETDAVLQAWYPGQAGGTAAANILFGNVSPSGKLPVTFYRSAADLPDFEDYSMKERTYRYFTGKALYPFGYGLTYTHFTFSDAAFDGENVTVSVKNDGAMDADCVVQCYARAEECRDVPPNPVLCGYERVSVPAGKSARVTLPVNPDAFTAVTDDGKRVPVAGAFSLYVGSGQPDALTEALSGEKSLKISLTR